MPRSFHSQQLASIRDEARILAQRAGDHEERLEALAAVVEAYVRHAEEALSHALGVTRGSIDHLQSLLSTQLQSGQDGVETARQLCAGAHQQTVAAGVLLARLNRDLNPEQPTEERSRRNGVLVADDHGDIREVIADLLRDAGFVVGTAANGLEALLVAYEMQPAVILMDVGMPVLDGIEATRLIKAAEATRQARVIAYTGDFPLGENQNQTLFAAVVHKPATPAVLIAAVQHVASL